MKKIISMLLVTASIVCILTGCDVSADANGSKQDISAQVEVASDLSKAQPTPTDISYSLERYNLIRRAYWVNGQEEKANTLVCPVQKPLGYCILMTESGAVIGSFVVDGKVSSLNSFLTPSSVEERIFGHELTISTELADVDGSYGENDNGIFFFTHDGKYIEWSGIYLYSSNPMIVENPVVQIKEH